MEAEGWRAEPEARVLLLYPAVHVQALLVAPRHYAPLPHRRLTSLFSFGSDGPVHCAPEANLGDSPLGGDCRRCSLCGVHCLLPGHRDGPPQLTPPKKPKPTHLILSGHLPCCSDCGSRGRGMELSVFFSVDRCKGQLPLFLSFSKI